VYVRRIWLGDWRDVWLVSYQRDLGVWMFLGVRRAGFLSAISLKMPAVLYLNKTNALDIKKKEKALWYCSDSLGIASNDVLLFVTCIHVPVTVYRSGVQDFLCLV